VTERHLVEEHALNAVARSARMSGLDREFGDAGVVRQLYQFRSRITGPQAGIDEHRAHSLCGLRVHF
jgi:hypothetical protein